MAVSVGSIFRLPCITESGDSTLKQTVGLQLPALHLEDGLNLHLCLEGQFLVKIVWLVANPHLAPRSFLTIQWTRLFNTPFLHPYNYWWLFQPSLSIYNVQLTAYSLCNISGHPIYQLHSSPLQIQCHQQPKEERPLAKIVTAKPSLQPNSEANKHKTYNVQKSLSSWHCFWPRFNVDLEEGMCGWLTRMEVNTKKLFRTTMASVQDSSPLNNTFGSFSTLQQCWVATIRSFDRPKNGKNSAAVYSALPIQAAGKVAALPGCSSCISHSIGHSWYSPSSAY